MESIANRIDSWINANQDLGGSLIVSAAEVAILASFPGATRKTAAERIDPANPATKTDITFREICRLATHATIPRASPHICKAAYVSENPPATNVRPALITITVRGMDSERVGLSSNPTNIASKINGAMYVVAPVSQYNDS